MCRSVSSVCVFCARLCEFNEDNGLEERSKDITMRAIRSGRLKDHTPFDTFVGLYIDFFIFWDIIILFLIKCSIFKVHNNS